MTYSYDRSRKANADSRVADKEAAASRKREKELESLSDTIKALAPQVEKEHPGPLGWGVRVGPARGSVKDALKKFNQAIAKLGQVGDEGLKAANRLLAEYSDLEQQVPCFHELVIFNRQFNNRTGHPWRDLNDLGLHLTVPGPRVCHVIPIPEENQQERYKNNTGGQ